MTRHIFGGFVLAAVVIAAGGCQDRAKEAALRQHALSLCGSLEHREKDRCPAEVDRNFERCSRPYLAREVDAETFASCLGFAPAVKPEQPKTLGGCRVPNIKAKLTLAVAKTAPWEGSAPRELNGERLYVAEKATLGSPDLESLRLEQSGESRFVSVELAREAAARLEAATGGNVGQFMVLTLNDTALAVKIAAPVPGPTLLIAAPGARLEDVCRQE